MDDNDGEKRRSLIGSGDLLFSCYMEFITNFDLQKIETNAFIANNFCEVFLDNIQLKNLDQIACDLNTE